MSFQQSIVSQIWETIQRSWSDQDRELDSYIIRLKSAHPDIYGSDAMPHASFSNDISRLQQHCETALEIVTQKFDGPTETTKQCIGMSKSQRRCGKLIRLNLLPEQVTALVRWREIVQCWIHDPSGGHDQLNLDSLLRGLVACTDHGPNGGGAKKRKMNAEASASRSGPESGDGVGQGAGVKRQRKLSTVEQLNGAEDGRRIDCARVQSADASEVAVNAEWLNGDHDALQHQDLLEPEHRLEMSHQLPDWIVPPTATTIMNGNAAEHQHTAEQYTGFDPPHQLNHGNIGTSLSTFDMLQQLIEDNVETSVTILDDIVPQHQAATDHPVDQPPREDYNQATAAAWMDSITDNESIEIPSNSSLCQCAEYAFPIAVCATATHLLRGEDASICECGVVSMCSICKNEWDEFGGWFG